MNSPSHSAPSPATPHAPYAPTQFGRHAPLQYDASSLPASALPASALPAIDRYFEVSLFLLVATGIVAVVAAGKLDPFSTLIPAAVLIWKAIRVFQRRGPELSQRAATSCVLAYFLVFPLDLWFLSRALAANAPNPALYAALLSAVHLLIFATLVRLLSARTPRDQMFMAMLAVTCVLASAILTVDTQFIISLAVFLVICVSTFVGLEIRRSAAGAITPRLELNTPAADRLHRAVAITSIVVAVGALVIGLGIFFMIPRFTTGYLSALSLRPSLMTGFSENVTLDQIGDIKKNSAVVMRVHIDEDPARAEDIHWRGIVLTTFDGRRWSKHRSSHTAVIPSEDGKYVLRPELSPPSDFYELSYTVLLEPVATDALFVAPRVAEMRGRFAPGMDRGTSERSSFLVLDSTGAILNPAHNDERIRYQATSDVPVIPPAQLRLASQNYSDDIRNIYLELPPVDARIKKLADQITSPYKNAYDKAANLERYLRTHYGYTLDIDTPPNKDPLAYFLFEKKSGHCEYYASSMAVMLRLEGIPSRFVTGFLPGEYNDIAGDYIVRASDAHAWVEAYFPGYGWITFDPTPPGNQRPPGFMAHLAFYWDWFQYNWNEWVVSYDFSHQSSLAHGVERSSAVWMARLKDYFQRKFDASLKFLLELENRTEKSRYLAPASLVALLILLIAVRRKSAWMFLRRRWIRITRRNEAVAAELAAVEYAQMLKLLGRRGWHKSHSQTAREFAAAIADARLSGPVVELTELYEEARFGSHPSSVNRMPHLLLGLKTLLQSPK